MKTLLCALMLAGAAGVAAADFRLSSPDFKANGESPTSSCTRASDATAATCRRP